MWSTPDVASSCTCPKASLMGRQVSDGSRRRPACSVVWLVGSDGTASYPRLAKNVCQNGSWSMSVEARGMPMRPRGWAGGSRDARSTSSHRATGSGASPPTAPATLLEYLSQASPKWTLLPSMRIWLTWQRLEHDLHSNERTSWSPQASRPRKDVREGGSLRTRWAAPMAPESPAWGWTATGTPRICRNAATTAGLLATPPWNTTDRPTGRPATTLSR